MRWRLPVPHPGSGADMGDRADRVAFRHLRNAIRGLAWVADPAELRELDSACPSFYDDIANRLAEFHWPGSARFHDTHALDAWLADYPEPLDGPAVAFLVELAEVAGRHLVLRPGPEHVDGRAGRTT